MKSQNSKVTRLLKALAIELKDLHDEKIIRIHDIINDERDGYIFNFIQCIDSANILIK